MPISIDFLSFAPVCGILISFGLCIFFGFRANNRFDELMCMFYSSRRDEWEKAGRPIGMRWRPPELTFFRTLYLNRSTLVRSILYSRWLFKTPEWIAETAEKDYDTWETIVQFRTSFGIYVICGVIAVAIPLLLSLLYN